MSSFLTDNFTGTAGTALTSHTPDTGGSWVTGPDFDGSGFGGGGAVVISNANRARGNATNYIGTYRNTATPASADYTVTGVLRAVDLSLTIACVLGRVSSSASTYYSVGYTYNSGVGTFRLSKKVAGTTTNLGSAYNAIIAAGTSSTVKLVMNGTTISMCVDGVQRASVTDSSIAAAGFAGVQILFTASDSTAVHIDSVDAGPIPTPAPPSDLRVTDVTYPDAATASVALEWDDNGADLTGFEFQYAADADFTSPVSIDVADGDTTTTSVPLTRGATYYLRVRAYNAEGGTSTWSNTVSVLLEPVEEETLAVAPSATVQSDTTATLATNATGGMEPLTYAWAPATGASYSNSAVANPLVTYSGAGSYTHSVTVTDQDGHTATGSVGVTIAGSADDGSGGLGTVSGSATSFIGIKTPGQAFDNAFRSATTNLSTGYTVRVYLNANSSYSTPTFTPSASKMAYRYVGSTVAGDDVLVALCDADGAMAAGHRYSVQAEATASSQPPAISVEMNTIKGGN